jgi:acyl-CoA thioesterase-1
MKSFWYAFILAAAATIGLAGCKADHASRYSSDMDKSMSGAPNQSNAPPNQSNAAPNESKAQPSPAGNRGGLPLIVCFGDSLTAGYGADEGQSYPDFLQQDLDQDGFRYRVINEGVAGDTTKDGVDRMSDVIAMRPAVVVLEFGGNDGLRGLKTETTRQNLATMIEAIQKTGAKIVLAGIILPPDYGPDYIHRFVGNYTDLAKQYNLPLLPFLLKDVYGVKGLMQQDNIHATDKGNQVVARNVLPLVEPLLKK